MSPPPPEDLILKRMLNIQNEIYMCYDHLSSCRQFATIWQRTDKENDEIMKKQQGNTTRINYVRRLYGHFIQMHRLKKNQVYYSMHYHQS